MTVYEFEYPFTPLDGDHQLLLMEAEDATIPLIIRFELDDDGEVEITAITYGDADVNLTSLEQAALLTEIYDSVEFGEFAHD